MEGLVHGRAWQVVHGGVDDAKILLLARFHEDHFGQTDACVADQRSTGFDHELALAITPRIEFGEKLLPQLIGCRWCVAVVVDAQTAAKVNVVNGNASGFNFGHQVKHTVHGI